MNSNQYSIESLASPSVPKSKNPISSIQQFVRSNLVRTITVTIAGSLLLTGTSSWHIWNIYNDFRSTVAKQFEIQKDSGTMRFMDEALTMSANMFVTTGNFMWEKRYNDIGSQFDVVLKRFVGNVPAQLQEEAKKSDSTSVKLLALEAQAFRLVHQGKKEAAANVLFGAEYGEQKQLYVKSNREVLAEVDRFIAQQLKDYEHQLLTSIVFAGVTLPLLLASWVLVLSAVRDYVRDRRAAQAALEESEQNLLAVNENLQTEAQMRQQQEEQIRTESELLQSDVAHILDVVCALEEGDLRIQAEVNDRATGLVSDTLNRLIESLGRIISVVVSTTQEVNQSAEELERVAVETAAQANYQTASVREVESLMNNVNALTADSLQQAIATDKAVQLAKSAVATGKQEMNAMVGGIETLQQGTDQIVKRSHLLNDFVDLAAQFSKDQKRVASLTRVLALNASTLSSRALKEQDPDQFASIANEFEAIARQVNNLATETNGSLVVLQQQTDRIQTVTSGLNEDVTEIGKLVQKFTTEINKSRQAFDNIEAITEQVAQVGQKVSHSSEDIVRVVRQTLEAVQAIATVAQTTETKANATREQINSMGNLARTLLEMVEFFQLTNISQIRTPQPPPPAAIDSQKSGFLPEHPQRGEAERDSSVVRETYEMILTTAE